MTNKPMRDADCVNFLQWALPQLELSWSGFRKVRAQVCKRLKRRLREIGVASLDDYRRYLELHPSEWAVVDSCCHITISRFYRDKHVFDVLGRHVLPDLAERAATEARAVRCWSIGCASGEEAYSLRLVWDLKVRPLFADIEALVLGTDVDPKMIERARIGCYPVASLRDLPDCWPAGAFEKSGGLHCLKERYRQGVEFQPQDIRSELPEGSFDLILCRNVVFTYFAPGLQRVMIQRIASCLNAGGFLVLGAHETLPPDASGFSRTEACGQIWHRASTGDGR